MTAVPSPLAGERTVAGIGTTDSSRPAVLIDVVAVVAAAACGLVGFRPVFGGTVWLVVGATALVAGLIVALLGWRFRWDALTLASAAVVTYFLLSGVVFRKESIAGVIPNLDTVRSAATGVIRGWAEVLTTLPPIGDAGEALAVPFISTFMAVLLAPPAARRTDGVVRAVAPLVGLVVTSILFGLAEPASLLLQGAAFAVVVTAWISVRRRGSRASAASVAGRTRAVGGALMLGLAALVATVAGSHLPGAGSNNRYVLRDQADPPFDPRTYPSPLAGYRRYTDTKAESDRGLADEVLFTVTGLPKEDRLRPIRLAVLDQYDGVVWNVAGGPNAAADASGVFERVGETMPVAAVGPKQQVRIEIGAYDDIWVPDLGDVAGIRFEGPRRAELADGLRFNRTTNTGAVPARLGRGDVVTITAVVTEPPGDQELVGQGPGSAATGEVVELGEDVESMAEALTTPADGTAALAAGYDRIRSVSDLFTTTDEAVGFAFSDGHGDQQKSDPGHSLHRMRRLAKDYIEKAVAFGNGEQYASMLALISRHLGVPSRVVMGFCEFGCGGNRVEVKGSDVSAWVEVNVAGSGWVRLRATPDRDKKPNVKTPSPRPKPEDASQPPPPPVTTPPAEEVAADDSVGRKKPDDDSPLIDPTVMKYLVGIGSPLLVIGGFVGGVILLKRRRRERRRTTGSTRQRVVGGWLELTDLAIDVGRPLPRIATRREAARLLGSDHARAAADMADLATFGPEPPIEDDVTFYWDAVDASGEVLFEGLGRFARAKARLNPASLVANRRAERAARRAEDRVTGAAPPEGPRGRLPDAAGRITDVARRRERVDA